MATRRVRVVLNALGRAVDLLIRKLVLDIVANLQAAPSEGGTPVDTGWARANWIPNVGGALTAPAGSREQAEAGVLPTDQRAAVARIAASYTASQGRVHITNNVPYILALNAGSSKQAPRNFVQAAIGKAVINVGRTRPLR